MNLIIEKRKMVKYLSYAETIANSKSTIPVLSNILMEIADGAVSFLSSNLESGIKITESVQNAGEGALAVNGRKLLSIIRELPDDNVSMNTDENNRLTIKSLSNEINAQFTIAGVARSEFPEVRTEPDDEYVEFNADVFKNMVRKVIYAISSDENKYSLTGVFIEKSEDTLNMVATDGKRLALVTGSAGDLGVSMESVNLPPDGVIVPKIVFTEILKYNFEKDVIAIGFSKNQIFFKYDNIRLTSNLIEGKYPEYKKIIPAERDHFFIADKEHLLNAIKRVSVLVDESYNQIKLHASSGNLVLSSQNPALGGAVEEIAIKYEGDEIDIALNYIYLLDCLKEIGSNEVKVDFENSERVVTARGLSEEGYINLIMPMKLNV